MCHPFKLLCLYLANSHNETHSFITVVVRLHFLMQNNHVVPPIKFTCLYLANRSKFDPIYHPVFSKKNILINMSFVGSLSNEKKATIVLNFMFPCNTSHVTDLHFRLTLIPEMKACALSVRNLPLYFGVSFSSFFSQFDKTSCVWCVVCV